MWTGHRPRGTEEARFGRREWFVKAIDVVRPDNASEEDAVPSRIYFTFIVFPPDTYEIGSPEGVEGQGSR